MHFKLSQLTHLAADVVYCQLSITHKLYVINYNKLKDLSKEND